MPKKTYGARALLNQDGYQSVGAIAAEVVQDSYGWNASVVISDCQRVITLDFAGPGANSDEHENDLYKVDTLIACFREFRKGLVKTHKMFGDK